MTEHRRRLWALSPLTSPSPSASLAPPLATEVRSTSPADDAGVAMLLDLAYPGTIDFDPSHSHLRELDIWRRVDHADDEASSVAVRDGVIVSACLIARELDTPLLYDIATAPEAQRQRLAALLLARSVDGLGQRGERSLLAWVTEGNVASERLLARRAFTAVTDPLDRDSARTLYRDIAAAQPSDLAAWLREAERSG